MLRLPSGLTVDPSVPTSTALDRLRALLVAQTCEHFEVADERARTGWTLNAPSVDEAGMDRWSCSWISTQQGLGGDDDHQRVTLVVLFPPGTARYDDIYGLTGDDLFIGRVKDPARLASALRALQVHTEQHELRDALQDVPSPGEAQDRGRPRL